MSKCSATVNYLLGLAKLLVEIVLTRCCRDSLLHFFSARSQLYACESGYLGLRREHSMNTEDKLDAPVVFEHILVRDTTRFERASDRLKL